MILLEFILTVAAISLGIYLGLWLFYSAAVPSPDVLANRVRKLLEKKEEKPSA